MGRSLFRRKYLGIYFNKVKTYNEIEPYNLKGKYRNFNNTFRSIIFFLFLFTKDIPFWS
jgi:hypothetical protein